ncbi:hypothetical protein DCD74_02380 [Lysobacter oculi]|uniref:Uncharacterized protein n=1 Tax=Solilutibacter oculi TaxID=2698682 RepID=A0A344J3T0_9GAMM|nr:hypothetical protein [Lysobacter oculi]AXA83690.1 hypothetical protein DCD74_02380 [Lysobacter oculi]
MKKKAEGVRPDGMTHKEHSLATLNLALQIADEAARSDVECYAHCVDFQVLGVFDLSVPQENSDRDGQGAEELAIAQRAARYIDLRMPHLPYTMHRDPANPNRVWFTDKE